MIEIKGIHKTFGRHTVLRDLSANIQTGETVIIQGLSGCGKTTLLRLVAGLDDVDGGEIKIDGSLASSTKTHIQPHSRSIGFVFDRNGLFPHLNVVRNIAFGLAAWEQNPRSARIEALLNQLDLTELESRFPHQLSAGQARRVSLARALAPQPKRLLLDEPLAHLDLKTRDRVLQVLRELAHDKTTTIIWVSHDLNPCPDTLTRTLVLHHGQLRET